MLKFVRSVSVFLYPLVVWGALVFVMVAMTHVFGQMVQLIDSLAGQRVLVAAFICFLAVLLIEGWKHTQSRMRANVGREKPSEATE